MKINYTPSLLTLLPVLLLLTACNPSSGENKAPPPKTAEVGVVEIASSAQPIVTELPGRTNARMIAEIRPQIGGIIQERTFVEGAMVRAGQTLYRIDPAMYEAAYASAQAALQKAEATYKSSKVKAERYTELVAINAVSKQDYDDMQATLKQSEADVALAKAALETARINLAYTRITAPISGRVETSVVTPGALVTANQAAALTTVQQLDPIYVDVTQSSSDLLRLKRELAKGNLKRISADEARIKVLLEDGSVYPHAGRLSFSGVTVNPTSGAVTLRAIVPNPEGLLMPGMYVRAQLEEAVDEAAILVPQQSVTRTAKGDALVLVVNAENKVEQRRVEVGRAIGTQWLVNAGLAAGDRVIVEGVQQIRVGDAVKARVMSAEAVDKSAEASGK
ncbi:MAG: efflux RND transporter periplasmic adaptor subunit [Methylophilaceae bacterium]|jgi:membrane fusion protein (multidrug efflux system)|uniref:efflux RND transporter periplasmic adaptor subunit n=1 Tax=Methylobacillus sp. MM3 TaxID=1848039 RepID=UPI0009EE2BB0|nr:efflux RND transporter periplasmic adaptor subunit [Methylobacillus sp. MM3]